MTYEELLERHQRLTAAARAFRAVNTGATGGIALSSQMELDAALSDSPETVNWRERYEAQEVALKLLFGEFKAAEAALRRRDLPGFEAVKGCAEALYGVIYQNQPSDEGGEAGK